MTISSDINTKSTALANIKTAIINKGGTISGDITTYDDDISNIPIPLVVNREVVNGTYQAPTTLFTFSLPINATNVESYSLYYAFYDCTGITSVDLSSLTTVSGDYALSYAFYGCTGITSADLSSLTTISGSYAFQNVFYNCTGLTNINLSSLTTISGSSALYSAFRGCTSLTSVDLSSLTTVSSSEALYSAFRDCTNLTTLSFPALTSTSFGSNTTQFYRMLFGCSNVTVHFPSNLQSVIGSWSDVIAGFGGTNTTVLFDLTATT